MYIDSWIWLVWPLMFLGMMVFCVIFSRRRGRWSCCSSFGDRHSRDEQIKRLEEEIKRLKGRQ